MQRRIVKLISIDALGPGTGPWGVRPGSRSGSWLWFQPQDMPSGYTDKEGWFEIERRTGWRIVRQVPKPPNER